MNRPYTEPKDILANVIMPAAPWLDEHQQAAVLRAFSSRGPKKGYLKATCPSPFDDPLAAAAWQGLQPNHHKLKVSTILMLRDPSAKELAMKLTDLRLPGWLDYDRHALTEMGVW